MYSLQENMSSQQMEERWNAQAFFRKRSTVVNITCQPAKQTGIQRSLQVNVFPFFHTEE